MENYVETVERFCSENEDLCKALIVQEEKIIEKYDQFPEAMCDVSTAIVFKKRFRDRLDWRGGYVNTHIGNKKRKVPHFWIIDTVTNLNIDLTAFQFDHIEQFICDVAGRTLTPCAFLIGTDAQFKRLGYRWFQGHEFEDLVNACPLKVLHQARKDYKNTTAIQNL